MVYFQEKISLPQGPSVCGHHLALIEYVLDYLECLACLYIVSIVKVEGEYGSPCIQLAMCTCPR